MPSSGGSISTANSSRSGALPSCQQSARQIVLDAGASYPLTIKENRSTIKERIESKLPDPGSSLLSRTNTPAPPADTAAKKRRANG